MARFRRWRQLSGLYRLRSAWRWVMLFVVMVKAAVATVRLKSLFAIAPVLSVTVTVKLNEPEAVGVPLRVPSLAKLIPVGRAEPLARA